MASRDKSNEIGQSRALGMDGSGSIRQQPSNQGILSRLPEQLFGSLFSRATAVQLKADQVLFLVGDNGDGCYRVEEGLLKVTMISATVTNAFSPFSARARSWVKCLSLTNCHAARPS